MKKVLILVQGISDERNYIKPVVEANFPLKGYDKIITVKTEKAFDASAAAGLPFWLKLLPKNKRDKVSDIYEFFRNKATHAWVTGLVREQILKYQNKGCVVDVLGHSLGTLIVLCSGTVDEPVYINKFFCFNSPLGFDFMVLRTYINFHVWRKARHFTADTIINIWGGDDYISREMEEDPLVKRSLKYIGTKIDGVGHELSLIIRAWKANKRKGRKQ